MIDNKQLFTKLNRQRSDYKSEQQNKVDKQLITSMNKENKFAILNNRTYRQRTNHKSELKNMDDKQLITNLKYRTWMTNH